VDFLQRCHLPRAIGAALLLLVLTGGTLSLGYSLRDDAAQLIRSLPDAAQRVRTILRKEGWTKPGLVQDMQKAATRIERTASESGGTRPAPRTNVTQVQIQDPGMNVTDFLWVGTLGALAAAGQVALMLFLVYFLLVSDDTFRRKLVRIAGDTLSSKKVTLEILNDIDRQIQRFLFVQLATSALVGVVSWLVFLWIGMENAALWGVVAGVLNSVPYFGPVLVTCATSVIALLQFGQIRMALLVGGASLLITSLEGYLLTPMLLSRASAINPVAMFISLLFWGWLWGVWGLLLGLPIMFVVKSICDRADRLKSVAELLGE
jgi:predicted PurR-regulated permease PerM